MKQLKEIIREIINKLLKDDENEKTNYSIY